MGNNLTERGTTRTPFVLLTLAAGALLSGCATTEPFVPQTMPTEYSEAVTALLPIGPHTIDLDDTVGSLTVRAQGYLQLPETHDLREACAYDIRVETRGAGVGDHTSVYEMRKATGGASWRRIASSTDPKHEALIGEWFAGDDLLGPAPSILLPVLWLEEPYGGDYWCNLRRLDQVTELTDPATGELAYRADTLERVKAANLDAWLSELLPAAGYDGGSFHRAATDLREVFEVGTGGPAYQQQMRITRTDESIVLTADRKSAPLTTTFTPTETRTVETVEGFRTYTEKAQDPAVRSAIRGALKAYREGYFGAE